MKKRYLLFLLLIPLLFLLFGGSLKQKTYYIKKNEEVHLVTKPAFFRKFLKTKMYTKEGKYEESVRCFLRTLRYQVNVLSFNQENLAVKKGEPYVPDTEHLTSEAKITSDVPIEEISETPGTHTVKVNDHGLYFTKNVMVVGFEEDSCYIKMGEKKSLDFGVDGEWKVKGDSVAVDASGNVETLKEGESVITFSFMDKSADIKVKVVDMKDLYWMAPGEKFKLPDKEGRFSAGDLVKIKKNKVKAVKCGKEKYTYEIKDLTFEGTVLVTDFPKEKTVLKGSEFTEKELTFSSSDEKTAQVTDNKVIAKEEGTCEITAEYENEKRVCKLTVFSVKPEKILGNVGDEIALSDAEGLEFSSENEDIVKVEDGKAVLTGGGASNIIYKLQNQEGKIPVYSSSYENGNDTGKVIKVAEDGVVHNMTVWCQHARNYSKYNKFLAGNGCSLCSLTCILNGYAEGYEDKTPPEVMDGIEKETVGASEWNDHHYNGADKSAMPMTLNGINQCMTSAGVHTEYIPSFEREPMKEDILNHLATGQPVVIEVSKTNQVTNKTDGYWSSSVHTVVLVGVKGDQVIVADPANISKGSGRGRIKESSLDFISQYMWSCTDDANHFYWS